MNSTANAHPFILFFYYIAVVGMTVLIMHPVVLSLSLIGSLCFYLMMTSVRMLWKEVRFYIFVFVLIAVTNPLFVHKGETILFFLNDNPVTMEAIIYGVFIAMMLVAVIFWSKAFSILMTSDKFVYLFGKVIPRLSLVISMALTFIPTFKRQIKKVHQTQKTLGLYTTDSMADRIISGVRTFNSMISWSLEHAIEQAEAMKGKGYGLKGRTHFTLFKWNRRDTVALGVIVILLTCILIVAGTDGYRFSYYPVLSEPVIKGDGVWKTVIMTLFILLPSINETKENLQWKLAKSRI